MRRERQRFEFLLPRWSEGLLTPDESREMEALMRAHPKWRHDAETYRWVIEHEAEAAAADQQGRLRGEVRSKRLTEWASIAIVLVAILGLFHLLMAPDPKAALLAWDQPFTPKPEMAAPPALSTGGTPLHRAAALGDVAQIRKSASEDLMIDAVNHSGETPLHVAATSGQVEVVRLLVERGADVNARTREGREETPMMRAAWNGHPDVLEALLKSGAGIEVEGRDGVRALMFAAAGGPHRELNRHVECIQLLSEAGASLDARDSGGNTALHIAALRGRGKLVSTLIASGARAELTNRDGKTPRDLAIESGYASVAEILRNAPRRPQGLNNGLTGSMSPN